MSYRNKLLRITLICYLPIVVLFATIRMLSAFGVLDFLNNEWGGYVLNIVIQVGLLFCLSIFLFAFLMKSNTKNVLKFFGFRKIRFRQILISILIGIVVYVLNVLIMTFINALMSSIGYNFSSGGERMTSYPIWLLLVNLFFTAVLPGVCEEVAHRGMILNGFSQFGPRRAVVLSALLFGLLHLNVEQVVYATLIGILVGYISLRTESIYPAMIVHFMNNAISVFMGFSSFHNLGFDAGFQVLQSWLSSSPILTIMFMILLIFALFIFLFWLLFHLFKFSALDRMGKMQKAMVEQYEKERYLYEIENIKNGNFDRVDDTSIQERFLDNFDKIYNEKAKQLGYHSDITFNLQKEPILYETDKIAKIILTTIIVIMGTITLFTFIWGIL